jgi:crotonobetainyl-CoA:carnitine CoA-transferase CaiB-like acyl-CoA transferase
MCGLEGPELIQPDPMGRVDTPPPGLGWHTAEILAELGYDKAEQERLRADNVI